LNLARLGGFDVRQLVTTSAGIPKYFRDARSYKRLCGTQNRFPLKWANAKPFTADFKRNAGSAEGHYFWQDLWAARRIFAARPSTHTDIGSRIDGFVAHVLTFMPVKVIDIRPLQSTVPGLTFIQEDATELALIETGSLISLSCLHALEHFGLGRYGDPIDPDAWQKALAQMSRTLAAGGVLYLSVPVGRERVEFNAQRVFLPSTIVDACPSLVLDRFCLLNDQGNFHEDVPLEAASSQHYACGMFEFKKPLQ